MTRARAIIVALCGLLLAMAAFHFLGRFEVFRRPLDLTDEPVSLNPLYLRWAAATVFSLLLSGALNGLLKQVDVTPAGKWLRDVGRMPESIDEIRKAVTEDKKP